MLGQLKLRTCKSRVNLHKQSEVSHDMPDDPVCHYHKSEEKRGKISLILEKQQTGVIERFNKSVEFQRNLRQQGNWTTNRAHCQEICNSPPM